MRKEYVEQRHGNYYLTGTRPSLDSLILAFRRGESPATICLNLEEVYGAIACYLGNQASMDDYLLTQSRKWAEGKQASDPLPPALRERLLRARDEMPTSNPSCRSGLWPMPISMDGPVSSPSRRVWARDGCRGTVCGRTGVPRSSAGTALGPLNAVGPDLPQMQKESAGQHLPARGGPFARRSASWTKRPSGSTSRSNNGTGPARDSKSPYRRTNTAAGTWGPWPRVAPSQPARRRATRLNSTAPSAGQPPRYSSQPVSRRVGVPL